MLTRRTFALHLPLAHPGAHHLRGTGAVVSRYASRQCNIGFQDRLSGQSANLVREATWIKVSALNRHSFSLQVTFFVSFNSIKIEPLLWEISLKTKRLSLFDRGLAMSS